MSTMAFVDSNNLTKTRTHRWNDSDELDVFEAARYFSGAVETTGCTGATVPQKVTKEERMAWIGGRKSLDISMKNPLPCQPHRLEKHTKEKKSKQPISPGGKLASFLNSLFSQSNSKKKKSKSATQSMKDEEESPGGRRKRRSSISHFQGLSNTEPNSFYSSSSSGFRTPPPYPHTPIKVYKEFRTHPDDKQQGSLPKCNGQARSVSFYLKNDVLDEKRNMGLESVDEKLKSNKNKNFSNVFLEKDRINGNGLLEKDSTWGDVFASKEKDYRKALEVEDGGESDSSSDLFELQNYDLGVYSNGLPVYETTHMESIKRGAPIANGTL